MTDWQDVKKINAVAYNSVADPAVRSLVCCLNGLHLLNPFKYIDYYSDPGGM